MTTAIETRTLLHKAMAARYDSGMQKAYEVLDLIDKCIKGAAINCETNTTVYILRLVTLDSEEEKKAYINTLKQELSNNGYHVTYSIETHGLKITWGY